LNKPGIVLFAALDVYRRMMVKYQTQQAEEVLAGV